MIEDQDLLDRLKAVDVPPTRLTTTVLVDAGRRRVVRRRALRAAGGVALVAVLVSAGPSIAGRVVGQPADSAAGRERVVVPWSTALRSAPCAGTRLALPSGLTEVEAEAVDPTGRYIVGNAVTRRGENAGVKGEDLDLRPVLWTEGEPQALPMIGASIRASAVGSDGTVVAVGGGSDQDGRWASVVRYTGGVPEKLGAPSGEWVFAALPKIDADGNVLAVAYRKSEPRVPAVLAWAAGSTTAKRLPLPTIGIETLNVTDAGTVVVDVVSTSGPGATVRDQRGDSRQVSKTEHVVTVWDQRGGSRRLPMPAGEGGYNFAARGEWVTANLTSSGTVARWSLRTGEMIDTGINAPAHGVNSLGWILAGESVQRGDGAIELAAAGGLTGTPMDASDTGLVIGPVYDFNTTGATQAPSPSGTPGSSSAGPYTWQCDR
jgi:hypothetical protein